MGSGSLGPPCRHRKGLADVGVPYKLGMPLGHLLLALIGLKTIICRSSFQRVLRAILVSLTTERQI